MILFGFFKASDELISLVKRRDVLYPRLCWDRKFHYPLQQFNQWSNLRVPKQTDNSSVFSIDLSTCMGIESRRYACESKSKFLFTFLITNIESYAYSSYVHYIACYQYLAPVRYIYSQQNISQHKREIPFSLRKQNVGFSFLNFENYSQFLLYRFSPSFIALS